MTNQNDPTNESVPVVSELRIRLGISEHRSCFAFLKPLSEASRRGWVMTAIEDYANRLKSLTDEDFQKIPSRLEVLKRQPDLSKRQGSTTTAKAAIDTQSFLSNLPKVDLSGD